MTRIKLHLMNLDIEFFIDPMPSVPRKSDLISVDCINEYTNTGLDKESIAEIDRYAWVVEFVSWSKDKSGYFAMLFCEGE